MGSRSAKARFSRRQVLSGLVGFGASALLAACRDNDPNEPHTPDEEPTATPVVQHVEGYEDPTKWQGRTLTISSLGDVGGGYLEAQQSALFDAFTRFTGAELEIVRTDLDELRQQVNAADVSWSLCDVSAEDVIPLASAGIIQELDFEVIQTENLFSGLRFDHGVGGSLIATVLSYRTDFWPGRRPRTWDDFWDLDAFPGPRGLQEAPEGTLEFALLGDGVPITELYPIDVDRAIESLKRIQESVLLWWRQGAQPTQMIAAGDIGMTAAWHNRIFDLKASGAPVNIQWAQGALSGQCWVVPSGAPEAEVAMDFINFATRPETTAAFSMLYPFGPVNRRAFDLLRPDISAQLPGSPLHDSKQFTINFEWWSQNREAVAVRFAEFLEQIPPPTED